MHSIRSVGQKAKNKIAWYVWFFLACDAVSFIIIVLIDIVIFDKLYGDSDESYGHTMKTGFIIMGSSLAYFSAYHPIFLASVYIILLHLYGVQFLFEEAANLVAKTTPVRRKRKSRDILLHALMQEHDCKFAYTEKGPISAHHAGVFFSFSKKASEYVKRLPPIPMIRRCVSLCQMQSDLNDTLGPLVITGVSFTLTVGKKIDTEIDRGVDTAWGPKSITVFQLYRDQPKDLHYRKRSIDVTFLSTGKMVEPFSCSIEQ